MTSAMFCSDMTWPVGLPCTRIPAHIRPTALLTFSQEHSVRTGLMMQSARGAGVRARVHCLPYVAREPHPHGQARAPSPMRAAAIPAAAPLSRSLGVTATARKEPARQLAWARGRWRAPPTKGWISSSTPWTNFPGAEVGRGALPAAAARRRSR